MFINQFVSQDFVNRYQLFVAGRRLNEAKMVWEYYVKTRSAKAYRQMLLDSLYHPPFVFIDAEKSRKNDTLYLMHQFEGKPLYKEYIPNTLLGIEYLWGGAVELETSEVKTSAARSDRPQSDTPQPREIQWQRVVYSMKNRKLSRRVMT